MRWRAVTGTLVLAGAAGLGRAGDPALSTRAGRALIGAAGAGLFQRASIVTGFGWLTALSAQALTHAPGASGRKP